MPKRQPVNGLQLISDFQTALISIATSQVAKSEAERSENAMIEHLRTMSGGYYLQPGALTSDNKDAVTHASLDAHIKKVQAEQIQRLNAEQLANLHAKTRADFLNRKVNIRVLDSASLPVESVWFDPVGGYRNSVNKRRSFQGVIEDILLDRNAIVIKPTGVTHLFNQNLQAFIVYVIDPNSFQPTIELTVL
jgi:hypothetical protein